MTGKMAAVTIRPARATDIDAVTAIYAEAVRDGTATYELDPPSRADMLERFAAICDYGYPYIVAQDGQAGVVGFAYAGPYRTRAAYRFLVEDSIYIAPAFHGRGIGRLLLDELIRGCEALGFRQMVAVIGDGSPQSASVVLHERMGFVHCGTMPGSGYKHGRWLGTTIMQLEMNGGASVPPDPDSLPERNLQKTAGS